MSRLPDPRPWLATHRAFLVRTVVTVVLLAAVVGIEWAIWRYAGPVDAIAYTMLFVLGASTLPVLVLLLQGGTPDFLAKGLWALGSMALDEPWLVQHDHEWRMHAGRTVGGQAQVYIDGAWHDVVDDANQTVLAWQTFGVIMNKNEQTLQQSRVDTAAERARDDLSGTVADGGDTVERGGRTEVSPEVVTGIDGAWLLDLKRYWSRGLEQMADIELIETQEEVTMRKEAKSGRDRRTRTIYGTIAGALLGVMTGIVVMLGF